MSEKQLQFAPAFITQSLEFLVEDYVPKIERCVEKLNEEQMWWRPNSESNSIGNLILHLCGNATQWIVSGLSGRPDTRARDAEFARNNGMDRSELRELLRNTIADVTAVLSNLNPESLLDKRYIQGKEVSVLHAVFHVTEHFSMHTGQIILLTKMLTQKDLGFYDFASGEPVHQWHSRISKS